MNEELLEYIRGDKNLNIFRHYKACRMIEKFVMDEIRKIGFCEPEYKLFCVVRDNVGYDIDTMGTQILEDRKAGVVVNKRLVDGMQTLATEEDVKNYDVEDKENFNRIDLFIVIFHELEHVRQAKMYETNTIDNTYLYKDRLLSMYFEEITGKRRYYYDNYKTISEETLANIKAIESTIKFFSKYNIEFTKEELEILKLRMEKYKTRLTNTQRVNPIDGKTYDLDTLYNLALQDQAHKIEDFSEKSNKR